MRKMQFAMLGDDLSSRNISMTGSMGAGGKKRRYDPEMLYVECSACGKPIMWERGRTTALLRQARINPILLDETCMILSDGCFACQPEAEGYTLSMVRLTGMSTQDMLLFNKPEGSA